MYICCRTRTPKDRSKENGEAPKPLVIPRPGDEVITPPAALHGSEESCGVGILFRISEVTLAFQRYVQCVQPTFRPSHRDFAYLALPRSRVSLCEQGGDLEIDGFLPGGAAEKTGKLLIGDQLVRVDGKFIKGKPARYLPAYLTASPPFASLSRTADMHESPAR